MSVRYELDVYPGIPGLNTKPPFTAPPPPLPQLKLIPGRFPYINNIGKCHAGKQPIKAMDVDERIKIAPGLDTGDRLVSHYCTSVIQNRIQNKKVHGSGLITAVEASIHITQPSTLTFNLTFKVNRTSQIEKCKLSN